MKLCKALLAAAFVALVPFAAEAQALLAADVHAVFPNNDDVSEGVGWGIDGRLGYELPVPGLTVIPEVVFGWVDFSSPDDFEGADPTLFRGMVGGRVGIGVLVQPQLYAHIGYGNIDVTGEDEFFDRVPEFIDDEAVAIDVGLALDLALVPLVDVGVHGAYNTFLLDEAFDWWTAGVHASLSF